ncbi:MAG TPA: acyl-CoA dehydrogenase family protein [Rubrobacteraceae bacterium]|nr:acyl-CoA dehydrogenase family protein [Rubrobacteraceae bacterium]
MEPSEEQSRLRELARSFAREEISPAAAEHDRAATFPHELVEKARELGLANILAPERYGGEGLGPVELCVVSEELSWGCVGIAGAILLNNLAADCLLAAGTEAQKKNYLGRLCTPGGFASYAPTDPDAGSDVAGITTRAKSRSNGWLLNGQKMWTGNATQAGFMVVFAKTDPGAGSRGISAFLVDSDLPGVEVVREIPKLGQKAYSSCEVEFRGVELPQDALLGRENEGFLMAMKVFDRSRPMVAAFGVGLAQRALDEALTFAVEREAFGRPIIEFQGTGFKLAEMGMKVEAARLLTQQAAGLAGRGERNTLEAAYAKAFAADTAMWAAVEAVQVFGGRGYSEDHPVAKLFRDAKAIQVYEGTAEVQRAIMVRELTKRAKAGARANEEVAR